MDDPVTRYEETVDALIRDTPSERATWPPPGRTTTARVTCGSRRGGSDGTGRGG